MAVQTSFIRIRTKPNNQIITFHQFERDSRAYLETMATARHAPVPASPRVSYDYDSARPLLSRGSLVSSKNNKQKRIIHQVGYKVVDSVKRCVCEQERGRKKEKCIEAGTYTSYRSTECSGMSFFFSYIDVCLSVCLSVCCL